jgi:AcrR family transcriptional regulator
MHGLRWRELEGNRPDHGHQGTDNRPGNRRHQGPGSYRQTSSTFQFPTRLGANYDTVGSVMKADASSVDKYRGREEHKSARGRDEHKAPPAAGRPRDPRIDAAILNATTDLLVEIGYSNLTMAAVAERAGTTKTALYRRWSSKAELVHEAAFPAAPTAIETPPGDITADLRAMIAAARDVFTSPVVRAAMPGLIADMAADADLNARVMERFTDLFNAVRMRLADAVRRGEVHAGVDPDRLVEIIGGATMLRVLLRPDDPLGDGWVDQTTAIVVHGVVT